MVIPEFNVRMELPTLLRLLRRYKDVPMSLADGWLVGMAELFADSAGQRPDWRLPHPIRSIPSPGVVEVADVVGTAKQNQLLSRSIKSQRMTESTG